MTEQHWLHSGNIVHTRIAFLSFSLSFTHIIMGHPMCMLLLSEYISPQIKLPKYTRGFWRFKMGPLGRWLCTKITTIEQPLTGRHLNPPKNSPHPKTKEKLQQDRRRDAIMIKSNPVPSGSSSPQTGEQLYHQSFSLLWRSWSPHQFFSYIASSTRGQTIEARITILSLPEWKSQLQKVNQNENAEDYVPDEGTR